MAIKPIGCVCNLTTSISNYESIITTYNTIINTLLDNLQQLVSDDIITEEIKQKIISIESEKAITTLSSNPLIQNGV